MPGLITETPTDAAPGDSTNTLLGKVIRVLKGQGGGIASSVAVANGADIAQGATTDARATDSTSAWTVISLLKGLFNLLSTGVVVSQTTASNLKVDLSGTGANATAIKVDGSAVTQPVDASNSKVGGYTQVIAEHVTVTAASYSAGNVVGGLQTLSAALRTVNGTAILESLIIMDRAAQKAPMNVYIFSEAPAGTYTDHAALSWGTGDDLLVLAVIPVAATDYQNTDNSKSFAFKSGLGIALKGTGGSNDNLYAVAVTSGTPTYAASTDVQFKFGFLQD